MLRAFFRDAEEGHALVVIAITMLAMLFGVGLAIDSGQLFNGRRTAQEAADAAAFAGATVLYQGGTVQQATDAAIADAALNGYATNVPTSGTTVTVSPPASGPFIGNPSYVEVVISAPVRTSLVPQQAGVTTVRARGVAGNVARANTYAVMALDQSCTQQGAINVGTSGILQVTGGGIELNSCSATAGTNTGSGTVTLAAGYTTDVVGNVSGTWPGVRAGRPVAPDPFAGLPRPSTNGLPSYSPACSPTVNQPGIYTTSFSSNCTYVLAPGVYVLKGAGVNLAGNSSLCTGAPCTPATAAGGVMLFLTNASYPAAGGACGTFTLQGNAGSGSNLSGPTTGTYLGMLLWQDAACTGTLTFGGNGEIDATNGTIYAPTATVQANGNNADVQVSQIVAKRIDVANGKFEVNFTTSLTYRSPLPALVE